jgi:predicted nuclease of restriction endonuclease-like (RecB) superfamily
MPPRRPPTNKPAAAPSRPDAKRTLSTVASVFAGYDTFIAELKSRIAAARLSAARRVNAELIHLYWDIGALIVEKQESNGWGEAVVERLSRDLRAAFPSVGGFSARNLWDMRRFHSTYSDAQFLRQLAAQSSAGERGAPEKLLRQRVAEIPWGHHLLILNKTELAAARLYYLQATARFGWSRAVLLNQIKARAYERTLAEGKTHNFPATLPAALAEQAEEALKSRYSLEFLGIHREVKERDLEDRLIAEVQRFILELGYGFCFIGRQHRLALGEKEYFVDLLFYHRFLKALVAIDLKIGGFTPEHAGKMDFYLNLLNDRERAPEDRPSIGIILCAEKDGLEVEFALKTKTNPIGVAEYELQPSLPAEFRGKLPTARQLTAALRLK